MNHIHTFFICIAACVIAIIIGKTMIAIFGCGVVP